MRSNRKLFYFVLLLTLTGCGVGSSDSSSNQGPSKEITYNSISGRIGNDGPVLAVKIDDTKLARPQIGIEKADLVYIEQVEGGLTRLAAIFSSQIPEAIGPVRSARISDIDILAQFGKVVFAYSGAQRPMYAVIASANLWDYGGQRNSSTIYTRDLNRPAPYNMVLRADLLLAKVQTDDRAGAVSQSPGWKFGAAPKGGFAIDGAVISWPASRYEATWAPDQKRWLLSNGGIPNLANDGTQLGATTFVIQQVLISNSIYRSADGGYTPLSETVGSGTGYILRDGRSFKALWNRASPEVGTKWTLADGTEIAFAPGSIWVALTDRKPEFTLTEQTDPLSK